MPGCLALGEPPLMYRDLIEQVDALKSIAEPTRLRLVRLLAQGELTVSELVRILGQSQPRVSRHLKLLCDAGVLERFREQHHVYYRVPLDGAGQQLSAALAPFFPQDDPDLTLDAQRLVEVQTARAKLSQDYVEEEAPEWRRLHELHGDEAAFAQAVVNEMTQEPIGELLDVATGTGRMLSILGPHCTRGTGIDLSRKMVNVARARLQTQGLSHCTVRQDDMYQMRFAADSFDTVTIDQVLYLADQPEAVVTEAARVLAPGGRLMIVAFTGDRADDLQPLGIAPASIDAWCRSAGLTPENHVELPGQSADITLIVARS